MTVTSILGLMPKMLLLRGNTVALQSQTATLVLVKIELRLKSIHHRADI